MENGEDWRIWKNLTQCLSEDVTSREAIASKKKTPVFSIDFLFTAFVLVFSSSIAAYFYNNQNGVLPTETFVVPG